MLKNVILKVLVLSLIVALVLAGCSTATTSMAVELPTALIAFIGMALATLFTAAAKWIFDQFGIDLSDAFAELAAVAASVVVLLINYGLSLVPEAYDNWLSAIISFLVVLVGGTGLFHFGTRKQRRA